MKKPIFSGHESFVCKTHWLKRGYEFVTAGRNFSDNDAVVYLGVGKNMVNSIKYWMKAFGILTSENNISDIATALLNQENGYDPFFEDMGTLWLMHYYLITTNHASIYKMVFIDYHQQRNIIEKKRLQNYIKHTCFDSISKNLYNENTISRDITVMLSSYYGSKKTGIEDSNSLLAPLNLVLANDDDTYSFNYSTRSLVPAKIFLYALLNQFSSNKSISFDSMKNLSLIFCLSNNELLAIIKELTELYSDSIVYSDNSGIKELQFRKKLLPEDILKSYYR